MKLNFFKKLVATAVACSMVVSSFSIWHTFNETEKQYVVVSKNNGAYMVGTYNLTSSAARKMKQSDESILVVEEDGSVMGSTAGGTETWKGNKALKEQYGKATDSRSFKNLEEEWNIHAVRATTA